MTLDDVLRMARDGLKYPTKERRMSVSEWIIDTLGEAQPCAYPEPIVTRGDIELVDIAGHYTPTELRAMCAMWLRAADEAEELVP